MELLFESRLEVKRVRGKLYFFQCGPEIHPEPVLVGDSFADGSGVSCYGSVLNDGGRYRMWYQAWPQDWKGPDVALVGYAESDDGLEWRKPTLNMVDTHGMDNNLCDLGFHSPAVFIDPDASPSHRYRATGCSAPRYQGAHIDVTTHGYYTAHSSDGLHWELDSPTPAWCGADVITSIYHSGRRQGLVAMKFSPRVHGLGRRSVWTAALKDGVWSKARAALIPDDFDDVSALARGFSSGDYYGMGMLPAGCGTVGFLWQFRHTLPRTAGSGFGIFGVADVSLAYQADEGERWVHVPGRPDFLTHGAVPWAGGGFYTASNAAEFDDEQRLYFSGAARSHGWYLDANWQVIQDRKQQLIDNGMCRIGFAHWPKWRLFGFHADPQGELDIDLGRMDAPCELALNYEAEKEGSIHVQLLACEGLTEQNEIVGRARDDAVPLTGNSLGQVVRWKDGSVIQPIEGRRVIARLFIDCASVYAYELQPVK